jgi:hypothetical protein
LIVVDTSVVVAFMNATDTWHAEVSEWLDGEAEELATTPMVIAEIDHLVATRGGSAATRGLWTDLAAGAYLVEWWGGAVNAAVRVAERYADSGIGLTDASLVALAERLETVSIATLDERHFRMLRPLTGEAAFRLLPTDR